MNKEITPKDALQMIQDNLTPRTLGILTVEFNVVKKALDYFEQLKKENQELKEKISKFEKPILYMCRDRRSRELERLRLLELVNTYNVPILLNDFETVKELEKLKKIIEIIKSKNVDIFFLRNNSEFDLEKYNYEIKDNTMQYCYENCLSLTQQEYDLLKEVLESE